jgi:trigger factor
MQITVAKQPKSTIRLNIELSTVDMQPYLDRAAETLSKQYKIEGFRPGKASVGIVTQKLGAQALWEEAAEQAVRKTFVDAVREHKLKTVGSPKITVHKLAADNPFVFHADVAVLPDVKLADYRSIKLKKDPVTVSPEKINQSIEDLRDMFAKETPVDRPAARGDKVEVDFELKRNGVPVEGGSSKNHPIIIGSGNFIPGFEDQLMGLKKGESKDFTLTFPKNYGNKQLAGQLGNFHVTVQAVFAVERPDVNDAFAKQAGKFNTVAELRSKIEETLRQEAARDADAAYERTLVEDIVKRSTYGDLPELVVNAEKDKMIHELREEVERRGGASWAEYLQGLKKSEDDLKKDFQSRAEHRVKAALLLRAVGQAEGITADQKDIDAEVQTAKKSYAQYPEFLKQIETEDYRDFVKVMLVNRKVIEKLKEWASQ